MAKEMSILEKEHSDQIQQLKKQTLSVKADELRKRDHIVKLKAEISRWQNTLRKNNVAMELEVWLIPQSQYIHRLRFDRKCPRM